MLERILTALGEPREGALTVAATARLRLSDGRPLPSVARAVLTKRAPARGLPGLWTRAAGSSLRGESIDKLIARFLKTADFDPKRYWDIGALAAAFPGACHPLDTDPPVPFLYVDGDAHDDYPVFALQQADDVLEVVLEAPSLADYYAMELGLHAPRKYTGGLYHAKGLGDAMRAACERVGLTLTDDGTRLFLEAPRKPEPKRPKLEPRAAPAKAQTGPPSSASMRAPSTSGVVGSASPRTSREITTASDAAEPREAD